MKHLISWFRQRLSSQRYASDDKQPLVVPQRRRSDQRAGEMRETRTRQQTGKSPTPTNSSPRQQTYGSNGDTAVKSLGPGKNVLIRKKHDDAETGTHESLTILDDDSVDSGNVSGIDPYNTGAFDRSKNWDSRFRK